jgi:segregation and condensation protein B
VPVKTLSLKTSNLPMPAKHDLVQTIEALLFVATEPLSLRQLSATLDQPSGTIKPALDKLQNLLKHRGIKLIGSRGRYSLVTHPDTSQAVERFLGQQAQADLSKPALETLAIVAYKQPVSRAQIDEIRGVSSEQTLRNLLARELIIESSSKTSAKVYYTSIRFLQAFGLSHPDELPPLKPLTSPDNNENAP